MGNWNTGINLSIPFQCPFIPLPGRRQVRPQLFLRRRILRLIQAEEALPVRGGGAGHQHIRGGAAIKAVPREDHGGW